MKTLKQYWLILVGISLLNLQVLYSQEDDITEQMDLFFQSQVNDYNLVSISSALIVNDKLVWNNNYGYKKLGNNQAVEKNTLYHQGSVSKTITLAALLNLLNEKDINLDEDINQCLPFIIKNPFHPNAPITFRMLMTHTSSLNDVSISQQKNKLSELNKDYDTPYELGEVLKCILTPGGKYYSEDFFLNGKPGTEYSYSNISYSILGYLVECISGISFCDYTSQNIFDPLKMKRSTFLLAEADTNNFAFQYVRNPESPNSYVKVKPYTWAGYMDGSLRTTPKEYSNFLIMLLNKGRFNGIQVLPEEVINNMLEIQNLPGQQSARMFKPLGRALLWNKVDAGGIELFHFNGFGSGFFTEVFFSPEKNIAGLFFITGQYESFPLMGKSISEIMKKLLETAQ